MNLKSFYAQLRVSTFCHDFLLRGLHFTFLSTTTMKLVGMSLMMVVRVAGSVIRALDGFGHPVAWWTVLKLPAHVQSSMNNVSSTPCDCPISDCRNVPTDGWPPLAQRATGLCYLYADSQNPKFRYFRDIGYECLGQGGKDPVSQTLKQKNDKSSPYWAVFNDQLNGIAEAFHPDLDVQVDDEKWICGGRDDFSAHAKGAVVFEKNGTGGFFFQTSTPNYPDPTLDDAFVRLGCQVDNNVHFAQHMLALSLEDSELKTLGENLQLARLCSGNFYLNGTLHDRLGSATLFNDGAKQENTSAAAFYRALLDPNLPAQQASDPMKAAFRLQLSTRTITSATNKSQVFEPLSENPNLLKFGDKDEILVLVKSPRAAVPPWALVAELLESDVSVASWWDGSCGIPSICAGDIFLNSPNEFCLNNPQTGVELKADGSAPFNIENLLQATWQLNDGSANLTWQLVGGQVPDGNHAKWGLTTPRSGQLNSSNAYVIFGDLNMEGFPCSKTCDGSQAGRGGSFFSLMHPSLHTSLATSVISRACRCVATPSPDTTLPAYEALRMCHHGCLKKIEKHLEPSDLPALSANASSFWTK
ncbi:hypothetical protein PsorP6_005155 [Peronosclerospora sorghi]|uniref:Uncharacterized protein n=1 Tax=Peronosclerospora sorghi TaxID=230839 RepID=A0ACC0W574_9STRA|nr:hypothetical protein PsorP6_005155 [Peronosclerospora sorghi]